MKTRKFSLNISCFLDFVFSWFIFQGQVLIKSCHFDVYYLQPASGRDKSLRYIVVSKNGHVGQGFSPESSSGSLSVLGPWTPTTDHWLLATDYCSHSHLLTFWDSVVPPPLVAGCGFSPWTPTTDYRPQTTFLPSYLLMFCWLLTTDHGLPTTVFRLFVPVKAHIRLFQGGQPHLDDIVHVP